jgi:hypothetical protein
MTSEQPKRNGAPRDLTRRELIVAAVLAVAVAVAMSWPLALHLTDSEPYDIGDPLLTTWDTAWLGHQFKHNPTKIFQANIFRPAPDTLAYTDALIGLAPFSVIGNGRTAALVRHGIFWIGAYALALLGAYLLAREIGAGPAAACVAAAAFAYAPFRLSHGGHLHVLYTGGIPLSLFLLVRGHRRLRAGLVIAGWIAAAWQLSLGWNLGLPFVYFLFLLTAVAATVLWRRGSLRSLGRPVLVASALGLVILAGTGWVLSRPYERVAKAEPHSRRTLGTVEYFAPPVKAFLAAPKEDRVWGRISKPYREHLRSDVEESIFPGIAVVALAGGGLFYGAWPRWLRISLAGLAVGFSVLALGTHIQGPGRFYPYRLLFNYAPGFQALRTPGRLMTFTALALGLLAACGVQVATNGRRWAIVLLAAVVAAEGLGAPIPTAAVPPAPAGIDDSGTGLQMHLPLFVGQPTEALYMFWTTETFPPLVNGYSGIYTRRLATLTKFIDNFPDRTSVDAVRAYGIRTVVVHLDLAAATKYADAASRPIEGLGLVRRQIGNLVIFDVR